MKVRRRNRTLSITIPLLEEPRISGTRKSMLIASTFGVRRSKLKIKGHPIFYVANAFFYRAGRAGSTSSNVKRRRMKKAAEPTKRLRHQGK